MKTIKCSYRYYIEYITKDLFYNGTFAITETIPDNGGLQGDECNIYYLMVKKTES